MKSDAQFIENFDKFPVEGLVSTDGLAEGHIDHLIVAHTHHDVALSLAYGLDGTHTRAAGQDAVVGRGRTATLQVTQDGYTHIELGELFLHAVGIVQGTALGTLGHNDDARLL